MGGGGKKERDGEGGAGEGGRMGGWGGGQRERPTCQKGVLKTPKSAYSEAPFVPSNSLQDLTTRGPLPLPLR